MSKLKNILFYPFKKAIEEVKKDKQLVKDSEQLGSKINIYPFIYVTYMFIFIISIMYLAILYLIIGGIFVEPLAFIGLIPTILTTCIFTLIYTKAYLKTKQNYLKTIDYNKNS